MGEATMNDTVLLSSEGAVTTLTLNRPKVLNALNRDMVDGLADALDRIEADPALRVVIVRGAGNGFLAGGDIKFFTELTGLAPAERRARFERFINSVHPVILRLRRLRQPVIAAVHGACAGFGMSLLMAADLAVAAEDSFFTLAYIHLGVSPDGGSTFALPRHLGTKKGDGNRAPGRPLRCRHRFGARPRQLGRAERVARRAQPRACGAAGPRTGRGPGGDQAALEPLT